MTGLTGVAAEVHALVTRTAAELAGTAHAGELASMAERLEGPLRIAIAGRVKAGKSTLLNALVGTRLAPTDAGECTKLVTWYQNGQLYDVQARLRNGSMEKLRFDRSDGALDIDLGGHSESDVAALEVSWPSSRLDTVTLIDTPGLASLNDDNSRRTRDFLELEGDRGADVDAVIYLMRHLHTTDVSFLDAYMDRSVPESSPVNAVAVLSRADEIGAGRADAMRSAQRIADRYKNHDQVRSLAATVVPLAGLLAETALTLREDEANTLHKIATIPPDKLERLLLSADLFCDVHETDLTAEVRRALLDRLGLFGVRVAVDAIRNGAATSTALSARLVEESGLPVLNKVIADHFLPRARVLQSRSVLLRLRHLAATLAATDPRWADDLDREAERIEASAFEFTRMRAGHLVLSGGVKIKPADAEDLERLLLTTSSPAEAFGLPASAGREAVVAAAVDAVGRWRAKANDPLAGAKRAEIYEAAARTAESLHAAVIT